MKEFKKMVSIKKEIKDFSKAINAKKNQKKI